MPHDVSKEARDKVGRWTAGAGVPAKSPAVVKGKVVIGPPRYRAGGSEVATFNVEVAANQFRAQGIAVESEGSDYIVERKGVFGALGVVAAADVEHDGKVYLSEKNVSFWSDPAGKTKEGYEEGRFSSGNPEHVVDHEAAHVLQYRAIGGKESMRLMKLKWGKADEPIAAKVSRYAKASPLEFTAEVYAGVKGGKKYGADVMELYGRLKGPKL